VKERSPAPHLPISKETDRILDSAVATVLAAAAALPERESLIPELAAIDAACARGYFLPDEDEWIKLRYSQYLSLRTSLLSTIGEIGSLAGRSGLEWESRLPLFTTAFAAACILMRANRFLVDLAADRPVVWKKLDESDSSAGIPRKSFTAVYEAMSSPRNQLRFLDAADFFLSHRDDIRRLTDDPALRPMVELLETEEPFIERRRREAIKRRVSYRWFSFLRRHRSAWKQVMNGMFEASGRAIADLRQPGIKPTGAPKRIHPALRAEVLALARPGDVFITRHDDALSNLFLPGFWPHGALFLGTRTDLPPECDDLPPADDSNTWFLESKKDGVKIRPSAETLAVDALVVLRPPLPEPDIHRALHRAVSHRGKPYDFLFDFRTADRLVCTEVIYRGFHGIDPVRFHLREVGGRLCLPAEEFLDQALACGFEIILTAGLGGDHLLTGENARQAFHASRHPANTPT
jgi:hypothetical protein